MQPCVKPLNETPMTQLEFCSVLRSPKVIQTKMSMSLVKDLVIAVPSGSLNRTGNPSLGGVERDLLRSYLICIKQALYQAYSVQYSI